MKLVVMVAKSFYAAEFSCLTGSLVALKWLEVGI